MSTRLHIEGNWPGALSIRRGWARAVARPWNDDFPHCSLRLIRGGRDFLTNTALELAALTGGSVFSPALYHSPAAVWKKAGFEVNTELDVMERRLPDRPAEPAPPVTELEPEYLHELLAVEEAAFEPFWRMSELGLLEAMKATPKSAALVTHGDDGKVIGFAIAGSQSGVSFLQRIAVSTAHSGGGLGTALVSASFDWARRKGARTMILNVRPDNPSARGLYEKNGFRPTATSLELLEFKG